MAGDFSRAAVVFKTQLAASPTMTNYAGLVRAELEQDNLAGALKTAQQAMAAAPGDAVASLLLGEVHLRSGEVPEAYTSYAKAIELDRCLAQAHFGISRTYDLVGRHASGAKELDFAHRLSPNDPEITAAWLELLSPELRAAPLRSLLAGHPALMPTRLEALATELAILDQHLTCRADPFGVQTFPLEPLLQDGRYRRSWGLKAHLNSVALPLLELDSSVDGIILNPSDAALAHVRPLATASVDASKPYAAAAAEMRVGGAIYRNCPVTVVPARAVDSRNSLIGTYFFRDHLLHIDYVAATLKLTPFPVLPATATGLTDQFVSSEEKGWSPVYIAGPHVLLPTLINKKGPFLFALDTGVGSSVLSPAVTASQLSTSRDATLNLKGSSSDFVKVIPKEGGVTDVAEVQDAQGRLLSVSRPFKLPVYRFANIDIPDDAAVSFDFSRMSHADGVEISGLLGFQLLSYFSIEINYRDHLAHLVFDQNRRYHTQALDRSF